MQLTNAYIDSDNFEKSVEFYSIIFNQKPYVYSENRWVEFKNDNKLAIFNSKYDIENLKNNESAINSYSSNYIDELKNNAEIKKNNIIRLNFYSENLKKEYEKLKRLNIKEISEVMYVNIVEPYYYFNIKDPDGNILEICGKNF